MNREPGPHESWDEPFEGVPGGVPGPSGNLHPPPPGPYSGPSSASGSWEAFPAPPEGPEGERPNNTTRNVLIGLVVAALVLALAVPLALTGIGRETGESTAPFGNDGPGPTNQPPGLGPNGVPAPVPGQPFQPDSVAVGAGSVWVSDVSCGVVVRIDPQTEEILDAIDVGGAASGVTFAEGSIWVGNRTDQKVVRLDPNTNRMQASIAIPGWPLGLASGGGTVWAVDPVENSVHRIDPATNEVVSTVSVGLDPHYVAVNDGAAWVTNVVGNSVTRIDPSTDKVAATVETELGPIHVIEAAGSVWVTNSASSSVSRIDRSTNEVVATIEVDTFPHALAFAEGSVWVGTESGKLTRIDPATNDATPVAGAEFDSIDMAVDASNIWVADASAGSVVRLDAASGTVAGTIDLLEYGDCATLRSEAIPPGQIQSV